MENTGDEFRRMSCYIGHAVENAAAAEAFTKHHKELEFLRQDELTREVFQTTYMRITARYQGGDFVEMFKALFYNTLRELSIKSFRYSATHSSLSGRETDSGENIEGGEFSG